MTVLVTGAAGFIGSHLCDKLLTRGDAVIGVDNLDPYYDVALKRARLARLEGRDGFRFHEADIADGTALAAAVKGAGAVRRVAHLAAQAGVRHSLENPMAYVHSNLVGHLVVQELCRHLDGFEHLVYASSSSVYGASNALPFSVDDRADRPLSLYAATKRADEMMSYSYSHLYRLPMTGLRFFTVYGPWGRPDMAAYLFTAAIIEGRPIKLFNRGDMKRDFTYIDDIVDGVIAALDSPPADDGDAAPHRLYNIGNNRSEPLKRFVEVLEKAIGKKAEFEMLPMQPGDVRETYADIDAIQRDLGFNPATSIDEGLPRFVAWYRDYHGV
jgi:UDP-glucuronate 4-epimerase